MYVHKVQLRSLISTCWKMSPPNSSSCSSKASWMSRRYTSGSLSLSDSADSADSVKLSLSADRDDCALSAPVICAMK